MNNFREIPVPFSTMGLLKDLREHGFLWNEYTIRTAATNSPHRECDDILVHFEKYQTGEFGFYPAIRFLPGVIDLCDALATTLEPDPAKRQVMEFGRIMITRLPAIGVIYKHADMPEHTQKWDRYHLCLTGSATFYCGDEEIIERPGLCFWFDNSKQHWVKNDSSIRIHLIVDVKK